jgi:hypothetical protein
VRGSAGEECINTVSGRINSGSIPAIAMPSAITVVFLARDIPVQSIKVVIDPVPLPRAEVAIISHAVDLAENRPQFPM